MEHKGRCGFESGDDRRRRRSRRHGRKERVLHTRVSEQLSDDIRRLAEDLRVPASNLVRNVLEEVFTVVENVSDDVGELFEDVLQEAEGARDRIRARRRARADRARRHPDAESEEDIEQELRQDEERDTPREHPVFPDVIGWQPIVLNRGARCADCERELSRGQRAFVGLGESGLTGTTLCARCTQANRP